MIIVIGNVIAKLEYRAEVLRLSLEHVKRSRLEPGCIDHKVSSFFSLENTVLYRALKWQYKINNQT